MLVYTSTHTLADGGPWYLVHGRNRALTIAYREGGYLLSTKPLPERWRVHAFSSWVMDANDQLLRGAFVQLGQLTGEENAALLYVKGNYQGQDGNPRVVLRGPFEIDYGLVTFVGRAYIAIKYYLRTVVLYEPS
ncbi:unnamed protein product [marine sediment metagenome]|uniref:Uncharacterized protein n=1 Tax=marine sediment metagenome TaxID=412755 RepID=X1S389_9ZZZZ